MSSSIKIAQTQIKRDLSQSNMVWENFLIELELHIKKELQKLLDVVLSELPNIQPA